MKSPIAFMLIALFAASPCGAEAKFHYELSGTSGDIVARINLDYWVLDWLSSLDDSDAKELERRVLSDPVFSQIDVEVTNGSDQSVALSTFTDALIIAAKSQSQFRPDTAAIANYPLKLLAHSTVTLRFMIPPGDGRVRAANTAAYLTGWDSRRMAEAKERIDSGEDSDQVFDQLADLTLDVTGDLSLGSANIDIPLSFRASVARTR